MEERASEDITPRQGTLPQQVFSSPLEVGFRGNGLGDKSTSKRRLRKKGVWGGGGGGEFPEGLNSLKAHRERGGEMNSKRTKIKT